MQSRAITVRDISVNEFKHGKNLYLMIWASAVDKNPNYFISMKTLIDKVWLERNQEHDNTVVPMLSIAQFNYCLGRTGMLGYWSDQNTGEYTYITLCGLIDKVHGEDWLGRVFVNYRDTQKIRLLTSAQSLPESLKIFLESPQLF